ncbi:MAG: hypothetical protein QGH97_14465 [Dehalococcoidia bacterium]|jgi:hypothetical protein|nr:hypothetical protein [Dehalococcoidia bacterium]MDP7358100.1 hypothetical protein [Pseudomonadales bacterium]|tara:strand:- start:2390 stop:3154 length:765 start_codon:yes stop_codon:yes gene_type:complete
MTTALTHSSTLRFLVLAGLIVAFVVAFASCEAAEEIISKQGSDQPQLEQQTITPESKESTVARDPAATVRVPDTPMPPVLERTSEVKDSTPTLGPDRNPKLSMELQAVGHCDEVKPRVTLANVTWKVDTEAGNRLPALEKIQTKRDSQRLDVTVYKRGFEKGAYVTLTPIGEDERFRDPNASTNKEQLPGALLNLTVEQVDWGRDTRKVVVGHAEPGINYSWRVLILHEDTWMSGGETSVQASVCVSDEAEEER